MLFFKVIYFHIYNLYYKNGKYTNDIPWLTAYGIAASSFSCLLVSLIATVYSIITDLRISKINCLITFAAGYIIFYFIYLNQSNYNNIYNLVKGSKWDTKPVRIATYLMIAIGFASVGLYSYLFNRK
jgi:hypothetical protein